MRLKDHEKQDKLKKNIDIYSLWSSQQQYIVSTMAAAAV